MRRLALAVVFLATACSDRDDMGATAGLTGLTGNGTESGDASGGSTGDDPTGDDAGTGSTSGASGTDPTAGTSGGSNGGSTGGDPSNDVCERWNADRADLTEGEWSGSVDTCDASDMDAAWRERSLRQINLYRWMAGLPPVTTDPSRDAQAQACALMMHANGKLSHEPPADWTCHSSQGSSGAYSSNIAQAPAVSAIDHYMIDWGNSTNMGHRRWILGNGLGPTGIGSTSNYSCMWALGGQGNAGLPWVAWPPPGEFPLAAVKPIFTDIDKGGWTVHSDSINLAGASVTVTANGMDMPVVVNELFPGPGSAWAIRFEPDGWSTTVDTTYHVEVSGIATPISYDVSVVDCG